MLRTERVSKSTRATRQYTHSQRLRANMLQGDEAGTGPRHHTPHLAGVPKSLPKCASARALKRLSKTCLCHECTWRTCRHHIPGTLMGRSHPSHTFSAIDPSWRWPAAIYNGNHDGHERDNGANATDAGPCKRNPASRKSTPAII